MKFKGLKKKTAIILAVIMTILSVLPAYAETLTAETEPIENAGTVDEVIEEIEEIQEISEIEEIQLTDDEEVTEVEEIQIADNEEAAEDEEIQIADDKEVAEDEPELLGDQEERSVTVKLYANNGTDTDKATESIATAPSASQSVTYTFPSASEVEFIEAGCEDSLLGWSTDSDAIASTSDAEIYPAHSSVELTEDAEYYAIWLESSGTEGSTIEFDPLNWMQQIPSKYPLKNLTIPGTHDSATYNIKFDRAKELNEAIMALVNGVIYKYLPNWLAEMVSKVASLLLDLVSDITNWIVDVIQKLSGTCQSVSIKKQLENGVRYVDLRFRYEKDNDGTVHFYCVHGCEKGGPVEVFTTCYCYTDSGERLELKHVFDEISEFLNAHPYEIVFFSLQNEGGTYNRKVEEALYALECEYENFKPEFAHREFSASVYNEITGRNTKNINQSEKPFIYGDYKGHALDISDDSDKEENKTIKPEDDHWSYSVEDKIVKDNASLKLAVKDHDEMVEIQTNVMVKIWLANDPNNECEFPVSFEGKWITYIPPIVWVKLTCDAKKLIKTPKLQANQIKKIFMPLVDKYRDNSVAHSIVRYEKSLGLVLMDFPSTKECCTIANVNTGNGYFYKGTGRKKDIKFVYSAAAAGEGSKEYYEGLVQEAVQEIEEFNKEITITGKGKNNSGGSSKLFTGTSGNPVSNGTWNYDAATGFWSYKTTQQFKNTWGYIVNPNAGNIPQWFWFDSSGNMLTGWQFIYWNGKQSWFFFNPAHDGSYGACQLGGKTPDGYTLNADGSWAGY